MFGWFSFEFKYISHLWRLGFVSCLVIPYLSEDYNAILFSIFIFNALIYLKFIFACAVRTTNFFEIHWWMSIIFSIDLKYLYHKQNSHLNIIPENVILFSSSVFLLLSQYHTDLVVALQFVLRFGKQVPLHTFFFKKFLPVLVKVRKIN